MQSDLGANPKVMHRQGHKSLQKGRFNMGQFIVGNEYYPYQREYGAMKVIRRTEKTIWCEKDMVRWSMRIKLDPDGNEYAVDTSVPQRDRDVFTYMTDEEE